MLRFKACLCLVLLGLGAFSQAEDTQVEARRQLLEEEKAALTRTEAEIEARKKAIQGRLDTLNTLEVTPTLLEQARLDVEAARIQMESVKVDQESSQRTLKDLETAIASLEERIKELQSSQSDGEAQKRIAALEETLAQKKVLLALEKQHLTNLETAYALAKQRLALAKQWYTALKVKFEKHQEETRKATLEELQLRLQKEQQTWLKRAAELRKKLENAKESQRLLLEIQIMVAEERARLAQLTFKLAQAENDMKGFEAILPQTPAKDIQAALEALDHLIKDLSAEKALWERKVEVFAQQRQVLQKRTASQEAIEDLSNLIEASRGQIAFLVYLLQKAEEKRLVLQKLYDESLRRGLLTRSQLPEDAAGWQTLMEQLAKLPQIYLQRLGALLQGLIRAWAKAGGERFGLLILLESAWLGFTYWRKRWLHLQSMRLARQPILRVLVELLERNSTSVAIVGGLFIFVWLAALPRSDFLIALSLLLTALGTKVFINLAWVLLVKEEHQPRLYRQLRMVLMGGGLFTAITLLGHIISLPIEVRDIIDRLFMVFLLLATFPAFGVRRLLLDYLETRFGKPYWLKATALISLLLPLSILTASVCGILGYLNLAWAIGLHLGWLLAVLTLWLLLQGLLKDLAVALKTLAYRRSSRSSLWTQGVIDPLYRLAQIGLFLLAWLSLFHLYGWNAQTPWVNFVLRLIEAPLLTFGNTSISLAKLIFIALAVLIVVWLGRWVREITFRWVYGGISDIGVRHSLAVFTQYAIVLLGLLILLRTGGIDLTTLAIFAGALGVGIGFGLQNIANNFVSGILLLAERPLRGGDIVRIQDYEGKVTRIGMRSLTVTTWDNQEVIIPNAEVISNAFINWTHTDNIVRTVIIVGISYDDDPHKAEEVMKNTLHNHPPVLKDPAPRVWLAEFADSSVNFHIEYFVDVRRYNRLAVRSQVLFALWDQLKVADIHIPYPQRDIYIKSMP